MSLRTGGQILVDQLRIHGTSHVFCVPGESYLAVLDALHDSKITTIVCRQEGGAAYMAEAAGKLTGRPGIVMVTRGPGATNASGGIHVASQDSTPLIMFVGQVARDMKEREAFQELDYKAVFGTMAKWVVEIDRAGRIPEIVSRAYHVAMQGRPGPISKCETPTKQLPKVSHHFKKYWQSHKDQTSRLLRTFQWDLATHMAIHGT